jgi:hypothetical protein
MENVPLAALKLYLKAESTRATQKPPRRMYINTPVMLCMASFCHVTARLGPNDMTAQRKMTPRFSPCSALIVPQFELLCVFKFVEM